MIVTSEEKSVNVVPAWEQVKRERRFDEETQSVDCCALTSFSVAVPITSSPLPAGWQAPIGSVEEREKGYGRKKNPPLKTRFQLLREPFAP